jgi:hypothetical protein
MIEWAQVNYRSDTRELRLSITYRGQTRSEPMDKRQLLILIETAAAALKKMEE